jgi:hypothetical protein
VLGGAFRAFIKNIKTQNNPKCEYGLEGVELFGERRLKIKAAPRLIQVQA